MDFWGSLLVGFTYSGILYNFFEHGATVADGFIGKIEAAASMSFLPGILFSVASSGNVHVFSLGIALVINGLIYSAALYGLLRLRRKFSGTVEA